MAFDIRTALATLSTQIVALARGRHPEPPSAYGLPVDEADELMGEIYARGDRLMGRFLLIHAGIAAGLSVFYETWLITGIVTLCALGLFFVNAWLLPRSFATRVAAGVALQTFVALHIYQMHGMSEMHFWFFTAFAMMIVYQDWLCMWPGTLLIIGQHILFALLHNAGVRVNFFEVDYISALKLTFHFGIALIHVGVCGYWAVLLRRDTLSDAGQRRALNLQGQQVAEARDQALAAARIKADFLATMSHEIRTPMNGVIGMTGLLRDSTLNGEQREFVEVIHESGESLLRIINDILDFSKIEAGRLAIEVNEFDLRSVIDSTVDLFEDAARGKGLRLIAQISPDVPERVSGDAGRIRQILVNLLGNALKFTERGSVTVVVSAIMQADTLAKVRIDVCDTGPGISKDGQAQLFQSFTRLDHSQSQRVGGTGLGLAICRRLAELMSGEVGVVSEIGEGSTFWFSVPLQIVRDPETTQPPVVAPLVTLADRKWHILVADDNAVNQFVSTRLLQKLGCGADVVADGAEALQAVSTRDYDLVLMDCQMPVMNGYEATAAIRQLPGPMSRIPIVAVTAAALEGERERCLAAGMDDYLSKPTTLQQLATVLRRRLRRDTQDLPALVTADR